MNLKDYIRSIPDYPKKGILFRDITTLIKDEKAFSETINRIVEKAKKMEIDKIAAIESRGFVFASAVSYIMNKPFILLRKKNKLPGQVINLEYDLEYGKDTLEVNLKLQEKKIIIVDDLLATGGTAQAACELLKKAGATVSCFLSLIELDFLNGRKKIDVPIETLIRY